MQSLLMNHLIEPLFSIISQRAQCTVSTTWRGFLSPAIAQILKCFTPVSPHVFMISEMEKVDFDVFAPQGIAHILVQNACLGTQSKKFSRVILAGLHCFVQSQRRRCASHSLFCYRITQLDDFSMKYQKTTAATFVFHLNRPFTVLSFHYLHRQLPLHPFFFLSLCKPHPTNPH